MAPRAPEKTKNHNRDDVDASRQGGKQPSESIQPKIEESCTRGRSRRCRYSTFEKQA